MLRSGQTTFRTPLIFVGLAGLYLWRLTLQPTGVAFPPNSPYTDFLISHLPNALYLRETLARYGQWPLWNAQLFAGQPFAADPLAGMWYLPNLLTLLLPTVPAFNLLLGLHLAWAGYGVYRLLRADGLNRAAALLGGAAFAGTPKLMAHLGAGHISTVYAVAWTPWLILAVRRARRGGWARGAVAGAVLAIVFLADVRWFFYSMLLGLAAWVFSPRPPNTPALSDRRTLKAIVGAGVFLGLLSAVLALPLEEFSRYSNRAGLSLAEAATYSLPPRYLIGLIIPDVGGFHEWMTYVGVIPLLLAAAGLTRRTAFWLVAALAAGVFSLGTNVGLYPMLFGWMPGLGWLRVPPRAWFVVALGVCVLAGHGAQRLVDAGLPWLTRRYAATWLRALSGPTVLTSLLVLTVVDLVRVDSTLVNVQPLPALVAAARWLQAQPGLFRVYSPFYDLPYGDGLQHLDGVDPLQLAAPQALIEAAIGVTAPAYSVMVPAYTSDERAAEEGVSPNPAEMGLLNVKYVASRLPLGVPDLSLAQELDGVYVYENKAFRSRAWIEQGEGAVTIRFWSPDRIELEAMGPGRVVLSEITYPGWRVSVNGRPATLSGAKDGLLRSVDIAAGEQVIVFEFRPPRVYLGAVLSAVGVAALAGSVWRGLRQGDL